MLGRVYVFRRSVFLPISLPSDVTEVYERLGNRGLNLSRYDACDCSDVRLD